LKLKQQVKLNKLNALELRVCSKINAFYIFLFAIFFETCQNSNFSQGSAATH